jgi:hypothetical protein
LRKGKKRKEMCLQAVDGEPRPQLSVTVLQICYEQVVDVLLWLLALLRKGE